jgi:hypothetical protein
LGNRLELCLSRIVGAFTIAVAKQRARYRLQRLGNLTTGIATIALAVSQRVRLVLRIRRSSNLAKISRWRGALGGWKPLNLWPLPIVGSCNSSSKDFLSLPLVSGTREVSSGESSSNSGKRSKGRLIRRPVGVSLGSRIEDKGD